MNAPFVNIAGYKFVDLDDLAGLKSVLLPRCRELGLRGTILLSTEGINLFVAGNRDVVDTFLVELRLRPEFSDLEVKESLSDHQPFSRMLVRLKKEIISMGVPTIDPARRTSPKLKATELKQWLDEGRPVTLLDTRNDYEVEVGTFENATPIGIDHFRKFPAAVDELPEEMKQRPLVMFCTGGIRCEKAGPLMEQAGFEEVYQLDGGILKYFEDCGGDHYDGDCFVFDQRVAVDPALQETPAQQCFGCQAVLSVEDQASPLYDPPSQCPSCFVSDEQKLARRLDDLNREVVRQTIPLPGSRPYCNMRPMNVPKRFDQKPVLEFLTGMHSQLGIDFWREECKAGRVEYKGQTLAADTIARAGWRVEHFVPQTVEPDVSNEVTFVYEDESIIAINKPAPLPMHPSGRFNRNSLVGFLKLVFPQEQLRTVHRLDANTTGIVLMCRKRSVAAKLSPQFVNNTVKKIYLAKVSGDPTDDAFICDAPISAEASGSAGSRSVDANGLESRTDFTVRQRNADGTTLLECRPVTGRTNQIRLHLSHLGLPIVGDPTYLTGTDRGPTQTRSLTDEPMCLHAWKITIEHPETGKPITFETPLPDWAS